jgi:phage-related holin
MCGEMIRMENKIVIKILLFIMIALPSLLDTLANSKSSTRNKKLYLLRIPNPIDMPINI